MANNIVWGCINQDGSIHSGTGFNVEVDGGGMFTVTYATPFSNPPAVVLTQNFANWNQFGYTGGSTLDTCVLVAGDAYKFQAKTGGADGQGNNHNFSFVVVGN